MTHYVITFIDENNCRCFLGIDSRYHSIYYISGLTNEVIYHDLKSAEKAYEIIKDKIPSAKLQKVVFEDLSLV